MEDQKRDVLAYLVGAALEGEIPHVVRQVRKVIDQSLQHVLLEALRKHRLAHYLTLQNETKQYTLAPFLQKTEDGRFVLPAKGLSLKLNADYSEILQVQEHSTKIEGQEQAMIEALESRSEKYLQKFYKEGKCVCGKVGQLYVLAFSAKKVNLPNFYVGEWISEWYINEEGDLQGRVKANGHFFENGNVQASLNKQFKAEVAVDFSDPEATAQSILKKIQKLETEMARAADQAYEDLRPCYFKRLRRFIPISGQKMRWNMSSIRMKMNYKKLGE